MGGGRRWGQAGVCGGGDVRPRSQGLVQAQRADPRRGQNVVAGIVASWPLGLVGKPRVSLPHQPNTTPRRSAVPGQAF